MFYKKIINGITVYEERVGEITADDMTEVTSEEFTAALNADNIAEQKEIEEAAAAERSKDERISELEQENAALLFEVLTGEAYADV